jgi:hypothetical protein
VSDKFKASSNDVSNSYFRALMQYSGGHYERVASDGRNEECIYNID